MRSIILFISTFTILASNFLGQNADSIKCDSIEKNLNKENNLERKLSSLIKLYEFYKLQDTIKSNYYLNLASIITRENNFSKYKIQVGLLEAESLEDKFNYNLSLQKYLEMLEETLKNDDILNQAYIYYKLSSIYRKIGSYNQAMVIGLKSLDISQSINDSLSIYRSYINLGNVYRYLKDYSKSLDFYTKSLEITKKRKMRIEEGQIYNNIGLIYYDQKKYDEAVQYYQKCYEIFLKEKYQFGIAGYYNNTGIIFLNRGDFNKAYQHFQNALKIRLEIGDKRNETNVYTNLGEYYTKLKDYPNALFFYRKALGMADKYSFQEKRLDIHLAISKLYEEMGSYKNALIEYEYYSRLSDSLLSKTQVLEIARVEIANKIERDRIIDDSKDKERNLKYVILSLVFSIVVLILLFFSLGLRTKYIKHKIYAKKLAEEKSKIEIDLHEKNKEFVAYSLYLAQKNELIKEISDDLRKNLNSSNSSNKNQIKEIIGKIESESNVNIWEEFEVRFLQVYAGFYDNLMLKVPSLTQNEKRLCAFLRLDMSTKEISLITGQTPHSINVARTRLRRKLGIVNNDQSISNFLSSL